MIFGRCLGGGVGCFDVILCAPNYRLSSEGATKISATPPRPILLRRYYWRRITAKKKEEAA